MLKLKDDISRIERGLFNYVLHHQELNELFDEYNLNIADYFERSYEILEKEKKNFLTFIMDVLTIDKLVCTTGDYEDTRCYTVEFEFQIRRYETCSCGEKSCLKCKYNGRRFLQQLTSCLENMFLGNCGRGIGLFTKEDKWLQILEAGDIKCGEKVELECYTLNSAGATKGLQIQPRLDLLPNKNWFTSTRFSTVICICPCCDTPVVKTKKK